MIDVRAGEGGAPPPPPPSSSPRLGFAVRRGRQSRRGRFPPPLEPPGASLEPVRASLHGSVAAGGCAALCCLPSPPLGPVGRDSGLGRVRGRLGPCGPEGGPAFPSHWCWPHRCLRGGGARAVPVGPLDGWHVIC